MKKICFITRHAIVNYGSFLQTYATQKLFEDYGYNAEVLDYVREDEEYHNVTELLLKNPKNGIGILLLDLYIESFNGQITIFVEEHLKRKEPNI